MLSVCVLYSMMVLGGRLRTRRNVSLMRAVVAWSLAVLFQMDIMSSWFKTKQVSVLRSGDAAGVCMFVLLDSPGSVRTQQRHRSPLRPWTAPPAWPGSGSPNIETPGLSLGEWSTSLPFYWHHPKDEEWSQSKIENYVLNGPSRKIWDHKNLRISKSSPPTWALCLP